MRMILPALAALAFSPCLQAGNVFKCKTADGSYVYQQAACETQDKQVDRIGFAEEPAPAPTIRPTDSAWDQQQQAPQQPQSDYYTQDEQRRQQPRRETVAHTCSSGGRTWTQYSPCPGGTYEQKLDRREFCRQLREPDDNVDEGRSRRVYNRNKARSERC